MQSTTIHELTSTIKLIQRAFPDGIQEKWYLPLLTILEPELSDRNLASVMANVTDKEYHIVLNDIYKVKSQPIKDITLLESTRSLLDNAGYQQWLEEE